jgi:hypothetical protein
MVFKINILGTLMEDKRGVDFSNILEQSQFGFTNEASEYSHSGVAM